MLQWLTSDWEARGAARSEHRAQARSASDKKRKIKVCFERSWISVCIHRDVASSCSPTHNLRALRNCVLTAVA